MKQKAEAKTQEVADKAKLISQVEQTVGLLNCFLVVMTSLCDVAEEFGTEISNAV